MQVYIEYAFLDNFIIDFILLKLSLKCAKVKTNLLRLIISATVGSVLTILLSLLNFNKIFTLLLKILLGLLITFLGGSYVKIKDYLFGTLYFFLFTFLSGGVIIALFNLADIDYENYFILNYNSIIPIGVTFLIVYISSKGFTYIIEKLISNLEKEEFFRRCEITINGVKIKANGYIDSGNRLYDNLTGLPVIMASKLFIKKLYENKALPSSYRNLKIETVSGETTIKIFNIEKLVIYKGLKMNIYNNVIIGESKFNILVGGECDLLLHFSLN